MACKTTGSLQLMRGHHSSTHNTTLEEELLLGQGARVMLCKNVDISDGLVNGVCGTVTDIAYTPSSSAFPKTIYVLFDDPQIGAQRCKHHPYPPAVTSTGIDPKEETVTARGSLRRQFPLKLAWACAVHKVQGLTVDKAVVSLSKILAPGQAYVALSRVRSLSGLVITDFAEKAIYCKDSIKEALTTVPRFSLEDYSSIACPSDAFTVFCLNAQGLRAHSQDLALCTHPLRPDCIVVTETWLPAASTFDSVQLQGYTLRHLAWSQAYDSSNPTLLDIRSQQHGGVAIYYSDPSAFHSIELPDINMECLLCHNPYHDIVLAVIYCPPTYPMSLFKENLDRLLPFLENLAPTIAIMGDFNEDILKTSSIPSFLAGRGFLQHITVPTTDLGTHRSCICQELSSPSGHCRSRYILQ